MKTSLISLVLAACLLPLLTPALAFAEVGGHVDADFDLGTSATEGALTVGGGGRFGWRFDLGRVWLQPEVGGHYTALTLVGCDLCVHGAHVARVTGGARLGGSGLISGVIEPALFAHGGYGWLTSEAKGPVFDVGFALDVAAVRYSRFGVQGAYNLISPTPGEPGTPVIVTARWISFGLHAGAVF